MLISTGQLEQIECLDVQLLASVDHRIGVLSRVLRRLLSFAFAPRVSHAELGPFSRQKGRWSDQPDFHSEPPKDLTAMWTSSESR